MTMARLFFAYMVLAGGAFGAALVAAPQLQDFWIKPYFWLLILVGVFDLGVVLLRGKVPGPMLEMNARAIGFVLGGVLMMTIPMLAGTPVRFF